MILGINSNLSSFKFQMRFHLYLSNDVNFIHIGKNVLVNFCDFFYLFYQYCCVFYEFIGTIGGSDFVRQLS